MARIVVIAGLERSGKMPLAQKLMREDPDLAMVHRDNLRAMFTNPVDETTITLIMGELADSLLFHGHTPLAVAWNLEPGDRRLWEQVARSHDAELVWLDTREPDVQALIPSLEDESYAQFRN